MTSGFKIIGAVVYIILMIGWWYHTPAVLAPLWNVMDYVTGAIVAILAVLAAITFIKQKRTKALEQDAPVPKAVEP